MIGYYELPPAIQSMAQNSMGTEVTFALEKYWGVLMLGAQVFGLVLVIDALMGIYKKYRYNQPHYGEYKIPLIVVGVLLFNMNNTIQLFANTLGINSASGW